MLMMSVQIRSHFVGIIIAVHAMNVIHATTEWTEPVVRAVRDILSMNVRVVERVAHTYRRTAVINYIARMKVEIAGLVTISMDLSGNAHVLTDGRRERLEDLHPSFMRDIRTGQKSLSMSAASREREVPTVMVPVAITRWTRTVAPSKNARVPVIRMEKIVGQERHRRVAPAQMDGW